MLLLNKQFSLNELSKLIGTELKIPNKETKNNQQSNELIISSLDTIEQANFGQVTFLANPLYVKYLENTKASGVILHSKYIDKCPTMALVTNNPRLALAKLLKLCAPLAKNPSIHNSCIIGKNVTIGKDVTIEAGVVIGDHCSIGNNTIIKANVVIYDKVRLGNGCIIHSNTVIGSDGFGYAQDDAANWVKMPHLGGVIIEDDVEIGSNTSIDRGCIGDTVIKKGAIIDNLVQIAHNVIIGEKTAIAGCCAIAGSTAIGNRCLIGGAVNIAGHLTIADGVNITGASNVSKSLLKPGVYSSGLPVKDNNIWRKNVARFNMLDEVMHDMLKRIKILEQKEVV